MLEIEDVGMNEFKDALTYLEKNFPKEAKRMLKRVGVRATAIVRKRARATVGKKTGRYYRSIKTGRVFESAGKELTVRVYSSDPKAHLIERGHRIVGKDGSEHGFKQGHHVFDKSKQDIENQYHRFLEEEFDKVLKKL